MNARQPGFTLVELMIVAVLGAFVLGTVYQSLIVQEQTSRAGAAMIRGQDALRTSLSLLESELREISTADPDGGTDLLTLGTNAVTFRAQRQIGFVCGISNTDRWMNVQWFGQSGADSEDGLLVFVDDDPNSIDDDTWLYGVISGVSSPGSPTCPVFDGAGVVQQVHIGSGLISDLLGSGQPLSGILSGAPVRTFDVVTYGLFDFGDIGWGLGRQEEGAKLDTLIGHLAAPADGGLVFSYYDENGAVTADRTLVTRIEIRAKSRDRPHAGVGTDSLRTTLSLRNN